MNMCLLKCICLILCVAMSVSESEFDWMLLPDRERTLFVKLTLYLIGTTPSESWEPPLFHFFSKANPDIEMSAEQVAEIGKEHRRLAFITHGFHTEDVLGHEYIPTLKKNLLTKHPFDYVVIVSWIRSSTRDYYVAKSCLRLEAEAIENLIQSLNIPLSNIELFGHGLGAHLMGTVARDLQYKRANDKVYRVVGLDPAGLYLKKDHDEFPSDELTNDVANEVVVINTNNRLGANDCGLGTHCYDVPEAELENEVLKDDWLGLGRQNYAWKVGIDLLEKPNPWEAFKKKPTENTTNVKNFLTFEPALLSPAMVFLEEKYAYTQPIKCPTKKVLSMLEWEILNGFNT